jgi:hypothetical protein
VIDTACLVRKDVPAMSSFVDHVTELVDRAGHSAPDTFDAESLTSWADGVGESVLKDITEWQPKQAVVIQMPKRRRAKR